MSRFEELLWLMIMDSGIPEPKREYRFHPERRWRWDFCWPEYMLALEVEGGIHIRGRHVRGKGYQDDCEKYNLGVICGWKILRFTTEMIEDGTAISQILQVMGRN